MFEQNLEYTWNCFKKQKSVNIYVCAYVWVIYISCVEMGPVRLQIFWEEDRAVEFMVFSPMEGIF